MRGSSPPSRTSSAVRPPAEQPITMARGEVMSALVAQLVDAQLCIHGGEVARGWCKVDAFANAKAKKTTTAQAVTEQVECTVLQSVAEVDQHIAAQHQVCFAEYVVSDQIVVGENHVAAQAFVKLDQLIARA